jgi:prevent-host-death family protein
MLRVGIAELKARLSEFLRAARNGEPVEVLDRGRPVARIVASGEEGAGLVVRPPREGAPAPGLVPLPRARKLRRDVLDYLREERGER